MNMFKNVTMNIIEEQPPSVSNALKVYFLCIIIGYTIWLIRYICNLTTNSQSTPPPTTTEVDYHCIQITQGLRDDVLATFATLPYSETKGDTNTDPLGCVICLADYKPTDVLKLLPECGHAFHVSCIDTWLKVHPTCPVCRNLFDFDD